MQKQGKQGGMPRLLRLAWTTVTALVMLLATPAGARVLELTFDDGPDGSGTLDGRAGLDNLETSAGNLGSGLATATFIGDSRRSALTDGRYGRAADFPAGQGGIEVGEFSPSSTTSFSMWLKPRSVQGGIIVGVEGSWEIGFVAGGIVASAVHPVQGRITRPLGLTWPLDGEFHHLAIVIEGSQDGVRAGVVLDFADPLAVELSFVPVASGAPMRLGVGYDGMLDELVIDGRLPHEGDLFDFSPTWCPGGLACLEEVITMTPRDFTHEVPVRFKSVYDPAVCTPSSPCPLVFDISGGNKCADDYDSPWSVSAIAAQRLFVVTIDFYCEGDQDTDNYPTETSQGIAVKDHMFATSPMRDRIAGPDYSATGCSHGAGTVAAWAMQEQQDYPARTWSRSTGGAGLCGYFAGKYCPLVAAYYQEFLGLEPDLEDPQVRAFHETSDLVALITPQVASTREIARSWGMNLEGPVCTESGGYACNEEGQWAMTYASRRFRDVWEMAEPADAPTGYFVQDIGADCRHCAPLDSAAGLCGLCFLRYGRVGMEDQCPECLTYADPTIERGPPGEACPIEAGWYTDPLAGAGNPDGGTDGGCACASTGRRSAAGLVLLILCGWYLAGRRGRR
jgi:hypothetical protein